MKNLDKKVFISDFFKKYCPNPKKGLDLDFFYLISSLTPMINVDILIKNANNETLLTWREDDYYGPGWHIPGGIIRFKEQMSSRIRKVAKSELGMRIDFNPKPIYIREVFNKKRDIRGHFISFLFLCNPLTSPIDKLKYSEDKKIQNGMWKWHKKSPKNLIKVHDEYKRFID